MVELFLIGVVKLLSAIENQTFIQVDLIIAIKIFVVFFFAELGKSEKCYFLMR